MFWYNMQGPDERKAREFQLGFTKNSAALNQEECEEKEEHLHKTELGTSQGKKQRKKRRKKKVPNTLSNSFIYCILSNTVLTDHRP